MTKDELKGFFDKGVEASKKALKKGAAASKVAFDKAGKAVSKFGDESILKIEIQQLKSEIKKNKVELGEYTYAMFAEQNVESISKQEPKVSELLEKIQSAQEEIAKREEALKEEEAE
ncbi:MAG: hypothetical protein KBT11_00560 [Treponema sp.]|nr:hypothetical protein [Candidatus Treponema equifaecale]